ncbi:hypothetical protein B0H14DRAFT_2821906 [Mycena olivaceomarginata]|nr:hypothetical protein B0H14DRAFT_2821906 [Mycena olivaceomarginata]
MSSIQKTKSKTPTCRVCHQRKVRCDGLNPCGSCTRARKPLVCEYFDPSARENTELPKGSACVQCRKRKRKCDGARPCVTCKNSSHSDACEYREQGSLREPRHERIVRTDRIVPIELSDPPPSVAISAPVESTNTSADGTLTQTDPCLDSIANTTTIYDSDATPPALPAMPGSEDDLATELSTVRSLFLHQAWYYGLNLNLEKRAAIACGDYSGSVIHPVFIPVSQLIGYVLASQDQSERFAYLRGHWPEREAGQCDLVLALLDPPATSETPVPDPLTNIQVYNLLALYSARRNDVRGLNEFLGNAGNIALRHHIELGLDDSSPVVPTVGEGLPQGVLQEGRSALAQLVYLDVAIKVIRNHPPLMPSVMLAKFRRLAVKNIEEIELNFVRARCILILADSRQLVGEWKLSEPGSMVGSAWGERWIKLVTCIQLQLGVLNTARSPGRSPTHRVPLLLLRSCTIVVLAAQAELYALLAPLNTLARQKHAEIIQTIADLSSTLDPADHQYFDCTLETCWEVASREIPESVDAPQWQVCFANAVLIEYQGAAQDLVPSQQPDFNVGRASAVPFAAAYTTIDGIY